MALTPRHRHELIAVAAFLGGLFVGLALLPLDVTGPVGQGLRSVLLQGLGSGALVLPAFGVLVGLAGFGWLGALDIRRTSILASGLVLLVPYVVGVVTGVSSTEDFGPAWSEWTLWDKAVGIVPGMIVVGVRSVIGTAGAVALGVVGLSALTLVTLDWHPFRRTGRGADGPTRATGTSGCAIKTTC